jgi:hypothetical protein
LLAKMGAPRSRRGEAKFQLELATISSRIHDICQRKGLLAAQLVPAEVATA